MAVRREDLGAATPPDPAHLTEPRPRRHSGSHGAGSVAASTTVCAWGGGEGRMIRLKRHIGHGHPSPTDIALPLIRR